MTWRSGALIVLGLMLASLSLPEPAVAAGPVALPIAQTDDGTSPVARARTVELRPAEGTTLRWRDRSYAGSFTVAGHGDGLALVEELTVDDYLLGIAEVPFSWPLEALEAQVVAARTYLAWTLRRGRSDLGRAYGFDICATDACQVYRGLDLVRGPGGERWAQAVSETAGEVLVVGDAPAQALYSSTTGGQTRSVQDVFDGAPATPYLQAVPSPDEPSPFVDWTVEVSAADLGAILRAAGLVDGPVGSVRVVTTEDGDGPWRVVITDPRGRVVASRTTWRFRSIMNRYGRELFPDTLPATAPSGRPYPQVILSPTYTIEPVWRYPDRFASGYIEVEKVYRFVGHGWGHLVGMSQYGALAMAERGATHEEILAHYYGGLRPVVADVLPDTVRVGLAWGEPEIVVSADGPVTVVVDGEPLVEEAYGTWRFVAVGREIEVHPPVGFGLPPRLSDLPDRLEAPAGRTVVVTGRVSAPGEIRLVVFRGPAVAAVATSKVVDAGPFVLVWNGLVGGEPAGPGAYRILLLVRSGDGSDHVVVPLRLTP